MVIGNRIRKENLNRVVETVWRRRQTSRADLARILRLDRSTTGQLVDFLLDYGVLKGSGGGSTGPRGGRPPALLEMRSGFLFSIGIELTLPRVSIVAVDLAGVILAERDVTVPLEMETLGTTLVGQLETFLSDLQSGVASAPMLLSVGVGVSGVVDPVAGMIELSDVLDIHDSTPVKGPITEALGVHASLLNDAQVCALGESSRRDVSDLLFALIEFRSGLATENTGVGFGTVIDRSLRHGRSIARLLLGDHPDDRTAFVHSLAHAIAITANACGIEEVVLGGDIEPIFDTVAAETTRLSSRADQRNRERCARVSRSLFGARAVTMGAAHAAVDQLFKEMAFPFDLL